MNSWQPRQTAPGRSSGSPLLAVNFLPVTYTADKFPADMIPFESPEQLRELRAKLAGTHAVTRAGDRIACVPLSADAPAVGRRTELDVREDRRIAAHLVEEALVRDVLARWYKLRRLNPPKFVNRSHDLFQETAQALGTELDGVHVYPQYSLSARATGPTGGPGIILGIKTRYEISLPVSELIRHGVHVLGRYVLVDPDDLDPRLDPVAARRLAGVSRGGHGGPAAPAGRAARPGGASRCRLAGGPQGSRARCRACPRRDGCRRDPGPPGQGRVRRDGRRGAARQDPRAR